MQVRALPGSLSKLCCLGQGQDYKNDTMKEKEQEKATRTYEVQVRDMPARIGAEERAERDASQVLPSEMFGTGTGELG